MNSEKAILPNSAPGVTEIKTSYSTARAIASERLIENQEDTGKPVVLLRTANHVCLVGIDVGSTTVKIAVLDQRNGELLYFRYLRHYAKQEETVIAVLEEAHQKLPRCRFELAISGSGGEPIANSLGAFFVQEVIANSITIKNLYPATKVAIELGGQDAKILFFDRDKVTNHPFVYDMRMNGCCAGGTGAFIDQIAELLHIKPEKFDILARQGRTVYDISGRCGVFAKTDIQPLLASGVPKEDIALSAFHAIVKQTIGGLAQGLEIRPPVIFEGGPLTFNPTLVKVFQEQLRLSSPDMLAPLHPEILVAHGTALAIPKIFEGKKSNYEGVSTLSSVKNRGRAKTRQDVNECRPFFQNAWEHEQFIKRHSSPPYHTKKFLPNSLVTSYLGIDAGSTTIKFVLIDENEEVIYKFYGPNAADPLRSLQKALVQMKEYYRHNEVNLLIQGIGTTGYGEFLFAKAFEADFHTVETVAHARAALKYAPEVSFILDIGGQDMKAIRLHQGVITEIYLNEACSAGCGSFVETYAQSLNIPVEKIAELAFRSRYPSRLGSRCTVFMNSSITTEQKNGKSVEDIIAGICRSIIENVFTKVIRIPSLKTLGDTIVVQGGTFKNDAILRAIEEFSGAQVIRPPFCGEMGALGIALLTKEFIGSKERTGDKHGDFFTNLENFDFQRSLGCVCNLCSNSCKRTIITFNNGASYVTGNRCERGEAPGTGANLFAGWKQAAVTTEKPRARDLVSARERLLFKECAVKKLCPPNQIRIGIPCVLEFYNSLPFWRAFFTTLGFEVELSGPSTRRILEKGLPYVASDTICFPAKIAHGHVEHLLEKNVDRIFMPMMIKVFSRHYSKRKTVNMCPVVQGYPLVIKEMDEPDQRCGVPFDIPAFHWENRKMRDRQIIDFVTQKFGLGTRLIKNALQIADQAQENFSQELHSEASAGFKELADEDRFAVILAGRPYHYERLINHNLSSYFTRLGVTVLTLDSIPELFNQDLSLVRPELLNPFHVQMFSAAIYGALHPQLEVAQIVSFGCGHDAIITDEMSRLLKELSNKELLTLKLDEGENAGPLNIRIRSFVETVRAKRRSSNPALNSLPILPHRMKGGIST